MNTMMMDQQHMIASSKKIVCNAIGPRPQKPEKRHFGWKPKTVDFRGFCSMSGKPGKTPISTPKPQRELWWSGGVFLGVLGGVKWTPPGGGGILNNRYFGGASRSPGLLENLRFAPPEFCVFRPPPENPDFRPPKRPPPFSWFLPVFGVFGKNDVFWGFCDFGPQIDFCVPRHFSEKGLRDRFLVHNILTDDQNLVNKS